jgi:hypothetical protein
MRHFNARFSARLDNRSEVSVLGRFKTRCLALMLASTPLTLMMLMTCLFIKEKLLVQVTLLGKVQELGTARQTTTTTTTGSRLLRIAPPEWVPPFRQLEVPTTQQQQLGDKAEPC